MIDQVSFTTIDAVPQYVDGGLEATINSIMAVNFTLTGPQLLTAVNEASSLPDISADLLLQLISDLRALGKFSQVHVNGELPDAITRPVAPAGFAANGTFFSTPTSGTYGLRRYVNGGFVSQRDNVDLSVDRSVNVAGLGPGDVLRVALVLNGVVGWWGGVTVA